MPSLITNFRSWWCQAMLVLALLLSTSSCSVATCSQGTYHELQQLLSHNASISQSVSAGHERWSQYAAPQASLYVVAGQEADVATVLKFANRYNYPFLLRNGGNGWADTFDLQGCGIIIDISGLTQVTFNQNKTLATFQGGAGVAHLVDAAFANEVRLATATCNCVGFLGAALGGGQTRQSGLYGLSVDQLVSANVVLASGEKVCVDASSSTHPGLWWALGGAGPNFGIVTSVTVRAHPAHSTADTAWTGLLTFSDDKLEKLMQAINDLDLAPNMQLDFEFANAGPPSYAPIIGVLPLYIGNTSAAEAAFASILRLGPTSNGVKQVPYNLWNSGSTFCDKGPRKPAYGASLRHIVPATWVQVYEEFKAFVASDPAAFSGSTVVAENYAVAKALAIGDSTSSYPFRDLPHHVIAIPSYANRSDDAVATQWAARTRALWWSTAGAARNSCYINFAHGDESLETIYGDSLPRLQRLKEIYDPHNRFNQWFPLIRK